MPRPNRPSYVHFTRSLNTHGQGRSRSVCGHITSEVTTIPELVSCLGCLRCLESLNRLMAAPELVESLVEEIRAGWGEASICRGAVLTLLLERIVARQISEVGLTNKLIAVDAELIKRGM